MNNQVQATLNEIMEGCDGDFFALQEEISGQGICTECAEIQFGCEPDAEGYECECCGADAVNGIEQMLMGL